MCYPTKNTTPTNGSRTAIATEAARLNWRLPVPTTTVPPLYLKLIHQFPLRPLRCDAELERAIAVSLSLDARGSGTLAPEERDYHNVLVVLISQYEEENHPI